jgi:DNA-binding MarR family transcriptional regulator
LASKVGLGNRRHLLNDISQIYIILNGQTTDGRNATYASLFKSTRYAIILLAAITLENFKAQTVVFRRAPFYNLYRLEKVADYLRLAYDRTKQAKKIYDDLEKKGEVEKEVTQDKRTYLSLTETGINSCFRKIQELQELNNYFAKIPPLQQKYTEEWRTGMVTDDLRAKSSEMTKEELEVEKLIESIAGQ